MMLRARRWGDNDRYFGPFTWSWNKVYRNWAIVLKSRGDSDGDHDTYSLRVSIGRATIIVALPNIIRPWRQKVYPGWDADTVKRLGRDWYWDIDPRQYGFSLGEGFLQIFYGRTGGACQDSLIQQQWSCFLPWTQWRFVRHSVYDQVGKHFLTEPKGRRDWQVWQEWLASIDTCPTVKFRIADYDGAEIIATTRIEEREWRFGTKWCKWLSWFRAARVQRSLNIEFSGETGPEKGSYKGGTIGTSIEMLPGEYHHHAFQRYCEQEHRSKYREYRVKYLGCVCCDAGAHQA